MSARDEYRPASADGTCTEAVWGPMCDEIDRLRATQHVDRDEIIGLLTIELAAARERADRQEHPEPFAQLLLTWKELDVAADCIEAAIAMTTNVPFGLLNSLRTAFREAQQHVEKPGPANVGCCNGCAHMSYGPCLACGMSDADCRVRLGIPPVKVQS